MATNPPCQSEDGNAAVFIGTFLNDGTSVTFCYGCLVTFCAAILEETAKGAPPEDVAGGETEVPEVASVDPTEPDGPESSASPASSPDDTDPVPGADSTATD